MKWRIIKISNLILALLLVAFTIGYTYAWFADYYSVDIKLYVSPDGGYFASGSGSETDPYIITRPTHLYNLAWLQNSGKFSSTEPTYFQIGDDDNKITEIDMDGYVIPPIGNDAYPFIGVFDGGGYPISNLIVSTDKNKLTNFPVESASGYEFSSYVGLFGKTGTYTDTTSGDTCGADIKNFILNDPILEVATENTKYSDATSESYCGLAIGYVAYKASSIGVIGGTLAVKKTGYSTYNSILGYFDEDKFTTSITGDYDETQEVTTVTGGDTGYFIPDVLFSKITDTNNYVSINSKGDEIQFKANTWLTSVKGKSGVDTNDYLGLGNFTVINGTADGSLRLENINSWNESNIDSNYYNGDDSENPYINAFQVSAGTYTIDGTEYTTSEDTIVYLANGANATAYSNDATKLAVANYFKSLVVDLEGTEYQKLSYLFYYKNSPTNVTKGFAAEVQLTVYGEDNIDVTGTSGGSTNSYYVFDNSIQVNISDPSNAKIFVIASSRSSSDERTLGVTQVYNKTDSSFTFYNDYTTFNSSSNHQEGDPKSTPQVTFSLPVNASSSGAIIMGYEIDLSSYGAGIYSINMQGSDGINIYYLAITGLDGTSGSSGKTPSDGTYNSDCVISAVDFIYKDVSITQSETTDSSSGKTIAAYNFVYNSTILYTPTGTRIWLNVDNSVSTVTTAVLIIAYTRDTGYSNGINTVDNTYTISVTYNSNNGSGTDTPGDSQLTGYAYFIKDSSTFITDTYFSTYYSKIVDVYENNSG